MAVKSSIKIYFYRLTVLMTVNPNTFKSDSFHIPIDFLNQNNLMYAYGKFLNIFPPLP